MRHSFGDRESAEAFAEWNGGTVEPVGVAFVVENADPAPYANQVPYWAPEAPYENPAPDPLYDPMMAVPKSGEASANDGSA